MKAKRWATHYSKHGRQGNLLNFPAPSALQIYQIQHNFGRKTPRIIRFQRTEHKSVVFGYNAFQFCLYPIALLFMHIRYAACYGD